METCLLLVVSSCLFQLVEGFSALHQTFLVVQSVQIAGQYGRTLIEQRTGESLVSRIRSD